MIEYTSETKSELRRIVKNYYDHHLEIGEISHADELFSFSVMHQLTALLCHMILSDKSQHYFDVDKIRRTYLQNYQLNMTIGTESQKLDAYLSDENIPHAYIKGQYLKRLYEPEGIRSMGDADIFVPETHMERVGEYMSEHGYTEGEYYGGVHTYTRGKVMFEVHNTIDWFGIDWSTRCTLSANGYTSEDETMLTILHILKHIAGFGCGMRQVLDVALLLREDNSLLYNEEFLKTIDGIHMTKCYNTLISVINTWFDTDYPCERDDRAVEVLSSAILDGGVFGGNINDYATVNTVKNRSKVGMYWHMLFPTYDRMVLSYPGLQGRKYLIGYYYMKRLFEKGIGKRRYKEVHASTPMDGALTARKQYVDILALNDNYYSQLK